MPRPEAATVNEEPYSALEGAGVVKVTTLLVALTVWLTDPLTPLLWLLSLAV